MSPFIICCRQFICLQVSEILLLGIFHPQIGDFLALFRQIPLNLHAKIQKNIRKLSIMEKKELSLQLNNINIGDFKMKKTNFAVAGLSLCLLFSSCGTNQKTGTAVGAGSGAALGALVGGLLNNSHRGTGALVGAAIGAAVGGGAGNLIGKHMDKVKAEAEQVKNAQVETVKDANGLSAVKVTFASGILFPTNGSTLSSSAKTDLAQFAGVLKNNTDCEVSIQGYTDATGNDGINLPLSQKRAKAVYNYLASCGVTSRQVKNVQGFGSANPVVNTTAACAQNRRVEVYMYASQAMVNAANNGTLK